MITTEQAQKIEQKIKEIDKEIDILMDKVLELKDLKHNLKCVLYL